MTFNEALERWESGCDPSPMVELLQPFADDQGIDIEVSNQKGCDCVAIEIQGRYVNPLDDTESGDAIMYLIQVLSRQFKTIDLQFDGKDWAVACWHEDFDGVQLSKPSLCVALLEIVWWLFPQEDDRRQP